MDFFYGRLSGNSARSAFALFEAGAPFTAHPLDTPSGENRTPDYLALNPMGKVPALIDGELQLWESNAINWYLAETLPGAGLLPSSLGAKVAVQRWMFFQAGHLSPASMPIIRATNSRVQRHWKDRGQPGDEAAAHHAALLLAGLPPRIGEVHVEPAHRARREQAAQVDRHVREHVADVRHARLPAQALGTRHHLAPDFHAHQGRLRDDGRPLDQELRLGRPQLDFQEAARWRLDAGDALDLEQIGLQRVDVLADLRHPSHPRRGAEGSGASHSNPASGIPSWRSIHRPAHSRVTRPHPAAAAGPPADRPPPAAAGARPTRTAARPPARRDRLRSCFRRRPGANPCSNLITPWRGPDC